MGSPNARSTTSAVLDENPSVHPLRSMEARTGRSTFMSHLTVELSGARAGVWAWHFIFHAFAPTIC